MIYDEAIAALNRTDCKEVEEKLYILKNRNDISENKAENFINETAGMIFSICKECKEEELYRIEKAEQFIKENENGLWEDSNSQFDDEHIVFTANPITPFIDGAAKCGDELLLLTYRKAVYENPKLVLLEGVSEGSTVLEILEKEGLSSTGKKNYLSICSFIKSETEKEQKDFDLLSKIANLLEKESKASGFCYTSEEVQHFAFLKNEAKIYYRCTSSIVCKLVSIEGSGSEMKVKIKPIAHNAGKIERDEPLEYEEFGEVGCFTFEMADCES